MKILHVDLLYDYGIKERGINVIGQEGFKKNFEKLGFEVVSFYYDQYLKDTKPLQKALIEFANSEKPDLIFFSLFRDQFSHETLQHLKRKYTTINWFGDDQWRFDNFTKYYANDFSWCITTDLYAVNKYKELGQKNVVLSQWAAIDTQETPASDGYEYDVSFVGGFHPYRSWFLSQLRKRGISVEAFGNGWKNGPLTSDEMNELFAKSKINLNISNSNSFDIRYLMSSVKAILLAIKSKKSNSQIKARNFEIPFFGGFQLTDYVPSLEQYFDIGKEIVCYASPEEAILQIEYFLENDSLRESIRGAGHQKALQCHGYLHRLGKALEEIVNNKMPS